MGEVGLSGPFWRVKCAHPMLCDVTALGRRREFMCTQCGERFDRLRMFKAGTRWHVICPCCSRFCAFRSFVDAAALVQAHVSLWHRRR